jgi:pimeloyl-ACP methyl ester carboxylesterase
MSLRSLIVSIVLLLAGFAPAGRGIYEDMFVPIGGIPQWVSIRGFDKANPVILFLHGGPGNAMSPFADSMFAGWDKDFTLVQWDQRGAGRTYTKNGPSVEPTMTLERMTDDGIEVAEFLKKHLGKDKIILEGGSWGSVLGIRMAHARPDLFYAYVGTAQVVNWHANLAAGYARVLDLARDAKDQTAVDALTAIGPPPWDKIEVWPKYRKWQRLYQAKIATAPPAFQTIDPHYASPEEQAQGEAADDFSFLHFWGPTLSGPFTQVDLPALGTDFRIPIYIVQGEEDLTTTPDLAKAYFDSLKAPRKKFILVPRTGHEPSLALLASMHTLLLDEVRPLASQRR